MHWGRHVPHVWFSWWRIDSLVSFLLTLGAMFMVSIVHESMSLMRRRMLVHPHTSSSESAIGIASFVRIMEALMSAMLILAIVTFNAWIILSICLGSAVGYYLALSMEDSSTVAAARYSSLEPALHH